MPKKKKLKLNQLKVKSFVTEMDDRQAEKVKGGDTAYTCPASCIVACFTDEAITCGGTCGQSCNGTCNTCGYSCGGTCETCHTYNTCFPCESNPC